MAYQDSTNHRDLRSQQRRTTIGPCFRYDAMTSRWHMEPSSPPRTDDEDDDKENLFSPQHALPSSLAFLNSSNIIEDSDEEDEISGQEPPAALAATFSADLVLDENFFDGALCETVKPTLGMDCAHSVVHRSSPLTDHHHLRQQHHPPQQRIPYNTATLLRPRPTRPHPFRLGTAQTITSSVPSLRSAHHFSGQQKGHIKAYTSSGTASISSQTNVTHATKTSSTQLTVLGSSSDHNNKQRRNKKLSQKDLREQYDRLSGFGARAIKPSAVHLRQTSSPYQVKLSTLGQVRPHPLPAAKQPPFLVIPSSFDEEDGEWPRAAVSTLQGTSSILHNRGYYPDYDHDKDILVPKRLEFTQKLAPQASFLDATRAGLKLEHSPYRRKLKVYECPRNHVPTTTAAAVVSPPRSGPVLLVDYQMIRDCSLSEEDGAAERSEFLLRKMMDNHSRGISDIGPDGGAFNSVIHAYARQGNPIKAEQILDLMWKDYYQGNISAEPNKRIYTTVMYAWEKSSKKAEAPEACESLLAQMHELYESGEAPNCKPDLFTYTCILHCWADSKRKDAAVRAEKLFRVMKFRFGQGDEGLRPDTICYSNLINAFLSCGQQVSRAEATFWEMVESAISGQNKSAPPTIRNFNTILAAWSKSEKEESPDQVERILRRWQAIITSGELNANVKPDTYSYSLLLKTWAKSKRPDSVKKLMEAFDWIKRIYNDGDRSAQMDTIKYATIIGALTNAKDPERAQEVLLEMVNDHYENGNTKAKPDAKAFHTVLSCWSRVKKSKSNEAAQQAEKLLRRQWSLFEKSSLSGDEDNALRPSTWTYNTVIFCYKNACDPLGAEGLLSEMDDMVKAKWMKNGPDLTTFQAVHDCWSKSDNTQKSQRMRALKKEAASRFGQQLSS